MKLRRIKKRAQRMMDTRCWFVEPDRMHYIRHMKPCPDYTAWCFACTATKFPRVMKRFPFSLEDFDAFERAEQLAFYKDWT